MFPAVLTTLAAGGARVVMFRQCAIPLAKCGRCRSQTCLRSSHLWRRFAELNVLRNFAGKFRREVEAHGLRTTDGSLAVLVTGSLDLKLFTAIVDNIPEGTWEFVCHPGYNDTDLDKLRTRLRDSREQELALLTSPEAKDVLQRRGVELISYHDL